MDEKMEEIVDENIENQETSENNFQRYIDEFFDGLELFDDEDGRHNYKDILKSGIDVFLSYESDYTAKEVYRTFFMIYQITHEDKSARQIDEKMVSSPNYVLNMVDVMDRYEKATGELIERQRDHFIHSVNVFLLGLAIYSQNKKYREIFKNYVLKSKYEKYYGFEEERVDREEFFYRWGLASLLHDIGYPFEIVGKQLKKIINDGVKSISNSYNVDIGIDYNDFNEFNSIVKADTDFGDDFREDFTEAKLLNLFKPTDIMAHKISVDFDFDPDKSLLLKRHLDSFVQYMRENDFIDHGFYSAILVLDSYGKIFQKYSKNKTYFFYPIVDSATAILLHNYYNRTLQKPPFNLKLMSPYKSPIAYLLILCDELQEWNRQPFGIEDQKKLHVNELAIEINNDFIDVEYILKKGSLGLGFSKDKKRFINSVLDVHAVFKKGLAVSSDVQPEVQREIMRNKDIADIQAPDVILRKIEDIAKHINKKYGECIEKYYNKKKENNEEISEVLQDAYDGLKDFKDFDELEPEFKISNLRQARSIPKKLNMIGCEIAPMNGVDDSDALTSKDFDEYEIEKLAMFEHMEWCREKRGTGWTYGNVKDKKKRESPYLVEWNKLENDVKQLDRNSVIVIPEILKEVNLKVVKSRIKALTHKMQQFYEDEVLDPHESGEEGFNELKDFVQYSNYKQANFIVKILNERGYELVPVGYPGKPIIKFDGNDLDHFAEREHYDWCELRYDLGWTFGSYNEDDMTSPNLVKWEDLDDDIRRKNRETFENLPRICDDPNVGLKIIKSE